jgi:hypothetical protein
MRKRRYIYCEGIILLTALISRGIRTMKNKIIGIIVCTLLLATAVPAVTSLPHNTVPSMVQHTSGTSRSGNWSEIQKLLAADGEAGDFFGYSVSIYGDTALVGAFHDNDNGPYSGSAFVFIRNGTSWTQQAKLLASDGQAGDWFGVSVSLYGDTALIGAHGDDDNGNESGSAYVFVRNGTTWTQQAKLLASDGAAGDAFGWSVSLYGDTALIGAQYDDDNGNESGSAYVFTRNGNAWTQQAELYPSDPSPSDLFGCSVSISGETALVGAYWDDDMGEDSGSAYVFIRTGITWTQQQKLLASDGEAGDAFGYAVSLDGDTALIGAYWDNDNGFHAGSAYVFTRNGTTWNQQAKLLASDGDITDWFGASVSVAGDTALIGEPYDDINDYDSGSAYMFTRTGTTWTQQTKLFASDGIGMDLFGWSVSLSGENALIGANFNVGTGSAYVFGKENEPPVAEFNWTPPNPTTYHQTTFNASASYDPDGTITLYEWDWNNDGVFDETHNTPFTTHVWDKAGSYPISLRVTDDGGATNTITKTVKVSNITITIKVNSGLGVTVVFTNKGPMDVGNVTWQVQAKGGKYGHINTTSYGLFSLQAGESAPRGTSLLVGLGPFKVTVQVADQKTTYTGIQIIIFSLILP